MDVPSSITVHYIKSPSYGEVPLHGIYGGVTPQGGIAMAIFSERMPIPNEVDLALVPVEGREGTFSTVEKDTRGKVGLIRTVHSVLHFDLETAETIRKWLDEKIAFAKVQGQSDA